MSKLCNCGDCRDAAQRAITIIEKMFGDNECPLFMAAVAEAMANFSVGANVVVYAEHFKIDIKSVITAVELAGDQVESYIDSDMSHYKERIDKAHQKMRERVEFENRLPKGD